MAIRNIKVNISTRSILVCTLILFLLSSSLVTEGNTTTAHAFGARPAVLSSEHQLETVLSKELAKAIGDRLEIEDQQTRRAAAKSLVGLGSAASGELPRLIRASAYDPEIKELVYAMLNAMDDKGLPVLIKLSLEPDERYRLGALRLLGRIGTRCLLETPRLSNEHWSAVIDALGDKETDVRVTAAEVLTQFCVLTTQGDDRSIPALIDTLKKDAVGEVRKACATALGNMGTRANPAASALHEALCKADGEQEMVAWALARTGKNGREFLIRILKDPGMSLLHDSVMRAVPELTCDATPVVPIVVTFLACDNSDLRRRAVNCLRGMRGSAKSAEPELRRLLCREEVETRVDVVWALAEIGVSLDDSCILILIKALHDANERVRRNTFTIVNQLGDKAAKLIPHLIIVLNDPQDEGMRILSAIALGCMGESARSAVPALKKALKDESEAVQRWAKWALDGIEDQAKE